MVHIPSGKTISEGQGLLSHYRVFTANHRYGIGAWSVASEAKLNADGSVEAHWPAAAADRPFDMWAVYRWSGPATLDVETKVQAQTDLSGLESFLASYLTDVAPARDCFAVSTPYETFKTHHSLYLSLFGRNIKAGETARARARLVVIDTPPSNEEVMKLYKAYMDFLRKR